MPVNFRHAAYSYLDSWLSTDANFHRILAFAEMDDLSVEAGAKCLVEVAKEYKVIRTLKKIPSEKNRLAAAYGILQGICTLDEGDVVRRVETFAKSLGKVYGGTPLSAASKFLWMRFRCPVIVYDSVVSEWLNKNCRYSYDGYSSYYRLWLIKYRENEEQIREACAELVQIQRFTRAWTTPAEQLTEWTTSQWFMQRVFDHFILNGVL